MTPPIRLALCTVYLYSLLASLNHVYPGWLDALTSEANHLAAMQRRHEELQEQMTAPLACEEAKRGIVEELLAGRLTLAEAATRFHDINNRQPGFNWTEHHRNFSGRSDEERVWREVVSHAGRLL